MDCHHVTGDCECNEGWKGNDCSEDVDECSSGLHSCNETIHQVCENSAGAAHCECQYGGLDLNDCIGNYPILHFNFFKENYISFYDINLVKHVNKYECVIF